jgi:hypothetical protein
MCADRHRKRPCYLCSHYVYCTLTEVFLNLTEVFLNLTEVFLNLTEVFRCFFFQL